MRHRIKPKLPVLLGILVWYGSWQGTAAKEQVTSTVNADAAPLLQQQDLTYVGAFRLPRGTFGGSRFGYSGAALAFNPNDQKDSSDDSLFISGHAWNQGHVAELSIPLLADSSQIEELATAKVLQPFVDITSGKLKQIVAVNSVNLSGLLVHENRIIWTALSYYDASYQADRSHGTSALDLSNTDEVKGVFRVGTINPGIVAGYMATIPNEWQHSLGAPLLTGQCNVPIITRTSAGPAAVAFDPAHFSSQATTPAKTLLVNGHLHEMEKKNPRFNFNSSVGGVVFPRQTRSILFFGGHATGEVCYGTGIECGDPAIDSKGWHDLGGHYVYQVWAYDAQHLVAVKNGTMRPEQVQPYAVWRPELPIAVTHAQIGGVAYDPFASRIFLVQLKADRGKDHAEEPQPLVHVLQVKESGEPR